MAGELDIRVEPGVTAMLAAAAEVGAPLGGDFCAISLSDNLKAWEHDRAAAQADPSCRGDFVIALYNPASTARTWQLAHAFTLLGRHLPGATPVIFGRAVGRTGEGLVVTTLAEAYCNCRRYGDAHHHRLARNARPRARREGAARLYAARRFFGPPA